jgi:hypothetical protein
MKKSYPLSAESLERHLDVRDRQAALLQRLWSSLIESPEPPDLLQMRTWLQSHALQTVAHAVERTAHKIRKLSEPMSLERAIKFTSKVGNVRAARQREFHQQRLKARP